MLGSRFDLSETLVEIARRDSNESVKPTSAPEVSPDTTQDAIFGDHCAELERQMVEVARRLHSVHPRTSFKCPICDSRMQLSAGWIVSEFAALGVEQHGLECDTCGLTTERAYHAAHGYQDILR